MNWKNYYTKIKLGDRVKQIDNCNNRGCHGNTNCGDCRIGKIGIVSSKWSTEGKDNCCVVFEGENGGGCSEIPKSCLIRI